MLGIRGPLAVLPNDLEISDGPCTSWPSLARMLLSFGGCSRSPLHHFIPPPRLHLFIPPPPALRLSLEIRLSFRARLFVLPLLSNAPNLSWPPA